jgi:hypothetical protein
MFLWQAVVAEVEQAVVAVQVVIYQAQVIQ